jgi:quinol monooxygenase YgiN
MSNSLLVVLVDCHVRPDQIDAFREATLTNARASVHEPGVARFDVIQDNDDPARFVLVEVYRSNDATAAHKQTGALPALARHGGADDGRAAHQPEAAQPVPRRRRLVGRDTSGRHHAF